MTKFANIVLDRITSTPGVISHKIENGILVLEFDNGVVVDMTVPEVVGPPVDIATFFDQEVYNESKRFDKSAGKA